MASTEGLTEEQAREIESLLVERKLAIEEEIKKGFSRVLEETAEETTVVGVEEGDESLVEMGKEMSFEVLSRRSTELKQVKEALLRLRGSEYGTCDECGNRIQFERLKAMPFAQLCRNCQDDSERRERERQRGGRGIYEV